jgi:hypothetical protein
VVSFWFLDGSGDWTQGITLPRPLPLEPHPNPRAFHFDFFCHQGNFLNPTNHTTIVNENPPLPISNFITASFCTVREALCHRSKQDNTTFTSAFDVHLYQGHKIIALFSWIYKEHRIHTYMHYGFGFILDIISKHNF